MELPCPNCREVVTYNSEPVRGPNQSGTDVWICLKCPGHICVNCYAYHTLEEHPEMYGLPKKGTSGGSKKNKKK